MSDAAIKRAIRQLAADPNAEAYSKPGEVVSVNASKRTCVVEPYDGSARIYNVRLQAIESPGGGIFPKPKKGSSVLVTFLSKNFAFVSLCSELDEVIIDAESVVFNGGQNKGLVKITDMVGTLNDLISRCNDLRSYLSSHTHPAPGGVTGIPTPPPTFAPLQPVQVNQFENPKVKH